VCVCVCVCVILGKAERHIAGSCFPAQNHPEILSSHGCAHAQCSPQYWSNLSSWGPAAKSTSLGGQTWKNTAPSKKKKSHIKMLRKIRWINQHWLIKINKVFSGKGEKCYFPKIRTAENATKLSNSLKKSFIKKEKYNFSKTNSLNGLKRMMRTIQFARTQIDLSGIL
jgi:hypothetical protein